MLKALNSKFILRVKCPFCGFVQPTTSVKSVRCFHCERSYLIFPKKSLSRVVEVVKGNKEI